MYIEYKRSEDKDCWCDIYDHDRMQCTIFDGDNEKGCCKAGNGYKLEKIIHSASIEAKMLDDMSSMNNEELGKLIDTYGISEKVKNKILTMSRSELIVYLCNLLHEDDNKCVDVKKGGGKIPK